MKEIFGEETKKKKAGIRLVREELFNHMNQILMN